MTVIDSLELGALSPQAKIRRREVIARLAETLSGGERQRLAIGPEREDP